MLEQEKLGMEKIKVSLITVSYNSEKTIKRTIESVLKQTYDNIEYIVIDGASKDDTVKIIEEYKSKFNGRLKVISEPDDGMYYAMNKGIKIASGEIVGIINSDDWYEEDAVSKVVKKYEQMSNKKHLILYGALRFWIDDDWDNISIRSHKGLMSDMIAHPACFVTRDVYEDVSVFDTRFKYVADYDFMLRMSKDERVVFEPLFEILANMQAGGASGTRNAWLERLQLQNEWGILADKEYKKILIKDKILYSLSKIKK